jgi:hypothetical protein
MSRYVTHLESALDGTRLAADRVQTVHQGRPLWVRYDLAAVRAAVTPADLAARPPSLWRYRELLPLPADEEPVTLGEGMTPLPLLWHGLPTVPPALTAGLPAARPSGEGEGRPAVGRRGMVGRPMPQRGWAPMTE